MQLSILNLERSLCLVPLEQQPVQSVCKTVKLITCCLFFFWKLTVAKGKAQWYTGIWTHSAWISPFVQVASGEAKVTEEAPARQVVLLQDSTLELISPFKKQE